MARASARVSDLEAGTLPPICAKTGEPADGYTGVEFSSAPGWTWILLLFGILPFLIAQHFATVRVNALVPMSDVAQRRVKMLNRLFVGLVTLSLVVIAIGLATEPEVMLWGAAMLVAALVVMFFGRAFVLPNGEVSNDWVRLSFVDARFAHELDRFYGR
jgi:hypothetical protein